MAANMTRLTHKTAIQLHVAIERYTICSSRSRRKVGKLLDTPSYVRIIHFVQELNSKKVIYQKYARKYLLFQGRL